MKKWIFLFLLITSIGLYYAGTWALARLNERLSETLSYQSACISFPLKFGLQGVEIPLSDGKKLQCKKATLRLLWIESLRHFKPVLECKLKNLQNEYFDIEATAKIHMGRAWKTSIRLEEKSWVAAIHGEGHAGSSSFDGHLSGEITSRLENLFPASFSLAFNHKDGRSTLESAIISSAAFFIELSGYLNEEEHFLKSQFHLSDLAHFSPLKGSVDGHCFLESGNFTWAIFSPEIQAASQSLQHFEWLGEIKNGEKGFTVLDLSYMNSPLKVTSQLNIDGERLLLQDIQASGSGIAIHGESTVSSEISTLHLTGDIKDLIQGMDLKIEASEDQELSLTLKDAHAGDQFFSNVSLNLKSQEKGYCLTQCTGQLNEIPFSLERRTFFFQEDDRWFFDTASFRIQNQGRITCGGEYSSKGMSIHMKGEELGIELPKGNLELFFNVLLEGTPKEPITNGTISTKGKFQDGEVQIPFNLAFAGQFEKNRLNIKGEGLFLSPVNFYIDLPCQFSLSPLAFEMDKESPLQGFLRLHTDLAPFSDILDFGGITLRGEIDTRLSLSGNGNHPEASGSILLKDGSWEDEVSNFSFSDLQAEVHAKGDELIIHSLTGIFGTEGKVSGTGKLLLQPGKHCPFHVALQLDRTDAFSSDLVHNLLSGHLVFEGDFQGVTMEGELTASDMEVIIPEESEESFETIEIIYLDDAGNPLIPEVETGGMTFSYEIKILIPRTLIIRDKKLFSRWRGDLILRGGRKESGLWGDLKVVEGEYLINGKRFEIRQGSVAMRGDLERKTSLYVAADLEMPKITAHVTLKGPLQNPVLSFRSTPPKSQREILSYLLFGKGISDISPAEGEELTDTLIELDQKKNQGPDMLTRLQDQIGIDQIDISRDAESESAVSLRIGKYLSRGVFVWLNRGINDNTNRVAIEARLIRNFLLQAEIGDGENSDNEISLKWKIDY